MIIGKFKSSYHRQLDLQSMAVLQKLSEMVSIWLCRKKNTNQLSFAALLLNIFRQMTVLDPLFLQVLLMILFRRIKYRSRHNLGHDRCVEFF